MAYLTEQDRTKLKDVLKAISSLPITEIPKVIGKGYEILFTAQIEGMVKNGQTNH